MERFLTKHKIWFEIFTPISIAVTLVLGVYGIFQAKSSLYLQFRPYVNLSSINFDGDSEIAFKLSNDGQSIAKSVFFIFAKFKDSNVSKFAQEAFEYRAVPGNFLILDIEGDKNKAAQAIIPVTIGEISPNTSRDIKLHLDNKEEILWLNGKNNWESLAA